MRREYAYAVALCLLPGGLAREQPPNPTFGTTVVIPSGLKGLIYNLHHNTDRLPDFERSKKAVGAIYASELNIPVQDFGRASLE